MIESRFIIGIDLGTTNIVVYYVDTERDATLRCFPVPQLIAAGEVAARPLFPSFCYLPAPNEFPPGSLALPWAPDLDAVVGTLARDHGAAMPGRLVFSAKSWLAHAGVDRQRPILPWGGDSGVTKQSPVAVTARYLGHLRGAWNHVFERERDRYGSPCRFEDQQLIVTIPASFDETARELTIAAARQAGYVHLTLLEEPLAAFYAWLSGHEQHWRELLRPGERVLVIDVGGGTTDFSFMELDANLTLHRLAAGDHLLLGGDNIDMAIARRLEEQWGRQLSAGEFAMLCQLCRRAKEDLLESNQPKADVTLLGRGSSVLRNVQRATLDRPTLLDILETGFYPRLGADAPPPRSLSGMRLMGLPYAPEPAVTLYLLHFLRYAARVAEVPEPLLFPDQVLFNGGSMKPPLIRQRILQTIGDWFPERRPPVELAGEHFDLAVAIGAAYYGRVRRGQGVKVRGGIARSYFLEVAEPAGGRRYVCVMARDTDENVDVVTPGNFLLQTNHKVAFNLCSSATRLHDRPGAALPDAEELALVAPLVTVLQFGKAEEKRSIAVSLAARLTEVGTLEVRLESRDTGHTWPLKFDLRPVAETVAGAADQAVIVVATARVNAALERLRQRLDGPPAGLDTLAGDLEQALELPRADWSLPLLRELADVVLELEPCRARSTAHELRWLNLAGWCLRPGFGDPADEFRLRQLWKLWFAGPRQPRQAQVLAEWWVAWRRVASGLKGGHQETIANALLKQLLPKGQYREGLREGEQAKREMWRCLGALELLPVRQKELIGEALLSRGAKLAGYEFWVLSRLGARQPFHGRADTVLPAAQAEIWLRRILALEAQGESARMRSFAIARLAALVGDRQLDLSPEALTAARAALAAADCPAHWCDLLTEVTPATREDQACLLGDSLPLGLVLIE